MLVKVCVENYSIFAINVIKLVIKGYAWNCQFTITVFNMHSRCFTKLVLALSHYDLHLGCLFQFSGKMM